MKLFYFLASLPVIVAGYLWAENEALKAQLAVSKSQLSQQLEVAKSCKCAAE